MDSGLRNNVLKSFSAHLKLRILRMERYYYYAICRNRFSLVPRPGRRRKEGPGTYCTRMHQLPQETWGATNNCMLFHPPPVPRVRSDVIFPGLGTRLEPLVHDG